MWEYKYDKDDDETTIRWEGNDESDETTIEGKITRWRNGYPATETAREAVAEMVQRAGTPVRIRMQFDLNYGFEDVTPSDGDS